MNTYRLLVKVKGHLPPIEAVGHEWQPAGDPIVSSEAWVIEYVDKMRRAYKMLDFDYELIATIEKIEPPSRWRCDSCLTLYSTSHYPEGDCRNPDCKTNEYINWNEELNKLVEEKRGDQ